MAEDRVSPPPQPAPRCGWANGDALMEAYHDAEWGVPTFDGHALFELVSLEGFQAGLSWRTILHRREGFRQPSTVSIRRRSPRTMPKRSRA